MRRQLGHAEPARAYGLDEGLSSEAGTEARLWTDSAVVGPAPEQGKVNSDEGSSGPGMMEWVPTLYLPVPTAHA